MAIERVLRNLIRAFGRIFPDCVTLSQAVAFNMFLAFFPLLLLALGLLGSTSLFPEAIREIPNRLMAILPPGSARVVAEYFVRRDGPSRALDSPGPGRHAARRHADDGRADGGFSRDRG